MNDNDLKQLQLEDMLKEILRDLDEYFVTEQQQQRRPQKATLTIHFVMVQKD